MAPALTTVYPALSLRNWTIRTEDASMSNPTRFFLRKRSIAGFIGKRDKRLERELGIDLDDAAGGRAGVPYAEGDCH
jgi:hypothetical protein